MGTRCVRSSDRTSFCEDGWLVGGAGDTKMDVMNPVWTYNDRGYYSIAFIGYIFLYALVIRGIGIPTPSVQHFKYESVEEESEDQYEEDGDEENHLIFIYST